MTVPDERMWTARLRSRAVAALPPDRLLPDRQPVYVASWIYVFGVLSLAALLVVLASGGVLALEGPQWYHVSPVGHFVNSLHLWSVELFFFVMVIHLWGKFFMAAWRGRRAATWITGVLAFLGSIATAFTGYLVQSNFDSQWIATQGKDGLNSVGVGAWFNVLNYGQMLLFHVVLFPLVLGVLVVWHILLVRRRGVVPPFPEKVAGGSEASPEETAPSEEVAS
jgi:Cytochrome b(N-terminal)/b6/petB